MNPAPPIRQPGRRPHPVWWVIAASLLLVALNLTFRAGPRAGEALAQSVRSSGARGIFAFSGQLTPSTFGVYMVDVDAGTIWCYEYVTAGGVKKLRLASARSWIFDRYLENFSLDGLSPQDVKAMVEEQRERYENPPGSE